MDPTTVTEASGHAGYARVAVARPVRGEFTYAIPEHLESGLERGQRLMVPFGHGRALGFYLGRGEAPRPGIKVRPLLSVLGERPAISGEVLDLVCFAAEHYRYPLGEALRAALPPGLTEQVTEEPVGARQVLHARLFEGADLAALERAPAQRAAASYLLAVGGEAALDELVRAVPGARESIKRLVARGFVTWIQRERPEEPRDGLVPSGRPAALTADQERVVSELQAALAREAFEPFLLHGVTGSGKTEVYLRLVEAALARGRGALVLVPEIALTPQLVGRFRGRFGQGVAVLHSGLKDRERLRAFQALRSRELSVAVGVRSAVFAPVGALGVVIVDEEHDPSFKQEDKLRYHARDLAIVRAKQAGALAVLGSATPSLESLENVRKGRYRLLRMPARVDDRPLPSIELVDLRAHRPRPLEQPADEPPILAAPTLEAMREVVAKGQQVILFLNRRGFSTFLVCEVCGLALRCHQCDVCLTYHATSRMSVCHWCGEAQGRPEVCVECGGSLLRLGVGTERVEDEVASRLPGARVARLDRDSATSAEQVTELLSAFARRELDVLVGTQMVAKGHDFPGVTLVCVVLADTSLAIPDFRAAERTFHLLTQVAGRAGRGTESGRVLIQTYNPESEVVQAVRAHDFEGFIERELARRRALAYPPYSRLAAIRLEGADADKVARAAAQLAQVVSRALPPASSGVRLLGPAPAPIARIKGRTRWHVLLKAPTHAVLWPLLARAEAVIDELPGAVRATIDVDPVAML